jgi:hypothetical protein
MRMGRGFRNTCYVLGALIALVAYGTYKIWEYKNTYEVSGIIRSAEDFRMKNDAHMPVFGKDVVLVPDNDPESEISFPILSRYWDETAEEGDHATFSLLPNPYGHPICKGMDDGK